MSEQELEPQEGAEAEAEQVAEAEADHEQAEAERQADEQETAEHLADNINGLGGAADAALDAPANEQEWEKRFATAEKRFATYSRAITALWEEDAVHLAPISISPSAPPGFIDVRDAGRVPDDLKGTIMEFLGMPREQEYEPDPFAHKCPTCKGKGRTSTGSAVASERSRQCPRCGGRGWEQDEAQGANGDVSRAFVSAPSTIHAEPFDVGERDAWGEPRLLPNGERNENFGKMPQFKQPHPKYGVTANLGATPAG